MTYSANNAFGKSINATTSYFTFAYNFTALCLIIIKKKKTTTKFSRLQHSTFIFKMCY
uniref:Uncharacterized protein n=1 Tax=Octopus bimaculoides TaxID=37653 RepID=A0A0L8GUK2_OCTBM